MGSGFFDSHLAKLVIFLTSAIQLVSTQDARILFHRPTNVNFLSLFRTQLKNSSKRRSPFSSKFTGKASLVYITASFTPYIFTRFQATDKEKLFSELI